MSKVCLKNCDNKFQFYKRQIGHQTKILMYEKVNFGTFDDKSSNFDFKFEIASMLYQITLKNYN